MHCEAEESSHAPKRLIMNDLSTRHLVLGTGHWTGGGGGGTVLLSQQTIICISKTKQEIVFPLWTSFLKAVVGTNLSSALWRTNFC